MGDGIGGRWPARGRPGSGAGPRGRAPGPRSPQPRCARRRGARPVALAAALAGTAALAAACGGGGTTPISARQANYQKALAFSQCMRAHGEPGFPAPQPNGGLLIDGPKDHLTGALINSALTAR